MFQKKNLSECKHSIELLDQWAVELPGSYQY